MPRLVTKTEKAPFMVGNQNICMCGLSEGQPFCDKSHKKTEKEADEKLYWYADGVAEEVISEGDNCTGQCRDGGCGHCEH